MDNKYLFKVYGKGDLNFADMPKKVSFRKLWILDTYGWRMDFITCYCPSCSNYIPRNEGSRSWKKYRKKQYKK